jgi:hypothetical protein
MTAQQVVQVETRKRSFFGKLVKWSFVGFNLLMLVWLFAGMSGATKGYESMSAAEQAGTAMGAGLGMMLILTIWAIGDVILGIAVMLTRGKRIITTVAG